MTVAVPAEDPFPSVAPAPPFDVLRSRSPRTPLIFSSPHAGRLYPADMMAASRLDASEIRRSEDAHVDHLIEGGRALGVALLICRVGRAYVDVNRDPWELDPGMFSDAVPRHARSSSARVAAGLGSVPRVVGDGKSIYARKLRFHEAEARLAAIHGPYHAALEKLMRQARRKFGVAVLVDWHSMPSAATRAEARKGRPRPDIVLGDRHGSACSPVLTELVRQELERMGYVVALNRPYAGGYTTQAHGRPNEGLHALQVELDRALYLDEATLGLTAGFVRLQSDLQSLFGVLTSQDWLQRLGQ
ncbi:MAG: N-formylglutamate amidohydrolase [Caulobacteraceae bacterium]|nr:N-formylglutamate amidohydrolase [Caulobacteraceae bacterium]